MRAQGSATIRSWLASYYQGPRDSQQYIDLWTAASAVDFRLAPLEGNLQAVTAALATERVSRPITCNGRVTVV